MLLPLLCLVAFMVGRVDVSRGDVGTRAGAQRAECFEAVIDSKEASMFLGLRTAKYEVQDVAKAKEWYSKVPGLQPYFDEPFYRRLQHRWV